MRITEQEIYIGDFIIEIYGVIEDYKRIYNEMPMSIAVDKRHYEAVRNSPYNAWVNPINHMTNNGVLIIKDERYTGTFKSARSKRYKERI